MNHSHLTASEISHYASLGMLPGHVVADRLPDIQQQMYEEAERDAEKAFSEDIETAANEEQDRARNVMQRMIDAIAPHMHKLTDDRELRLAVGALEEYVETGST